MRRHTTTFEELVLENKKEILSDPEALARIEKRIDERAAQRNEKPRKQA